ncbi:DUF6702 family protein [Massilia yuzhufengensis]|uniref:Orphan protein n=1 Tax=Massilia yuzhufengensis TaxID=1164594 RepID=A0A1I1IEP5_9BURK|nr:DUF6702 family protein [Massilia yuzhufengensis]SFC34152.1 hypothetical protein SAMN05216204_105172 [Massilia yuzhufengensis]
MILRRTRVLFAAALLCLSAAAGAHRFHSGITELAYNPRTKSTEIVHTYMAHDIEALLMNTYGRQFDLTDPDDQDVLRKYIEQHFWLKDRDNARLPLRWVGMTVASQSIVIYQELENTPLSKTATIGQGVLIDFLPDQVNTVNLNDAGTLRSLTFTQAALEQPVTATTP